MGEFQGLNNRELSIAIWLTIAVVVALLVKSLRISLLHCAKSFFAFKLSILYLVMFLYIGVMLWVLNLIGYWGLSNYTGIVMWVVIVAFLTLFKFGKAHKDNYFKETFRDNIKLIIVLEFIINLSVFSLPVEIVMLPFITFLAIIMEFSKNHKNAQVVHDIFAKALVIIGVGLAAYAAYQIFINFEELFTLETLGKFLTPILLSILFMPFIYLVALYATYEKLFLRIEYFIENKDKIIIKHAKFRTIIELGVNLKALREWSTEINKHWFKGKVQYTETLFNFKQSRKSTT